MYCKSLDVPPVGESNTLLVFMNAGDRKRIEAVKL